MIVSSKMAGFKLFVFTILLASTLISAVPHHRIAEEASILDDEIQKDTLSQQLIRAKKSVDSSEVEDVAEKKVNNEIKKKSSQGASALWAQTTLNDVEMDRQKNEVQAKSDVDRSRRQYCGSRAYPIDGTLMSSYYVPQEEDSSSSSSMRSASTDDAQLESSLGNSAYSSKTFSLHQSLLPLVHQPITHGVDEALPIYKPVKQVVQQVIQPIQPVIQPVVHPVQHVIQPVYQQIEPIVKPPVYQPIYQTPMHLPAIHQSLPSIHQQHPLFQHPLPMLPTHLHTPLCPCPTQHLLGASRSADAGSRLIQDQSQDSQQLQSIALYRDASQDGSSINAESSFVANIS